jgi:uncharacterized protein (TIGR02145 family)
MHALNTKSHIWRFPSGKRAGTPGSRGAGVFFHARDLSRLASLLILSLLFSCCRGDGLEREGAAGEEVVLLSVRVPGSGRPATYAMTGDDENEIKNIFILLFDQAGICLHAPVYGSNINTPDPGNTSVQVFTARVPVGDQYNMVIIANAAAAVASAAITAGGAKADVMQNLFVENSGKWNASPGTPGYAGIPMWGEIDEIDVKDGAPVSDHVTLTRAMVKIDVSVDPAARSKFKLKSVSLYNYNDRGWLIPAAGKWNGATGDGPTVLAGASKPGAPLAYDLTTAGVACEGEIYAFESEKDEVNKLSNTCLVLGGVYDGDAAPTYYRVDFANTAAGTTTYLDLTRNHHYSVSVTAVSGPGLEDEARALNSLPVNIEAGVIPWNDGEMGDVVFNGQEFLSASPASLVLPGEAAAGNSFSLLTDARGGWTITGTSETGDPREGFDLGWLAVDGSRSGDAGVKSAVTFSVDENTGVTRAGYIHARAGRLAFAVKVTQHVVPASGVGAWITDLEGTRELPELLFPATGDRQPAARRFLLRWTPAEAVVNISTCTAPGAIAFEHGEGSDTPVVMMVPFTDPSGQKIITIRPAAFSVADLDDPFIEKASTARFEAVHGGVTSAPADILLRQARYSIVAEVEASYLLDGREHAFTARANTAWKIVDLDDPRHILQADPPLSGRSGAGDRDAGETVTFKLVFGDLVDAGEATFTLRDPAGLADDVPVTIRGVACGKNGVATSTRIGQHDYLIHAYNGKCWMVQNSMEGTAQATYYETYETRVNGYYYTHAQATGACPGEWELPTTEEFTALKTVIDEDKTTTGKWWFVLEEGAFAGHRYGDGRWYNWNQSHGSGYWWSTTTDTFFQVEGNLSSFVVNGGLSLKSVRCILR